ncbi:hypothetical protein TrVFT333_006426 [Trichoderma virens FT-333]|nr:hypothetical protein TrVFT333_006426 [Trichoderma virens FT-333]
MESIFSCRNTKPPDNNLDLNELKSLYNGNGGEVLKKSKNISNICKDESPPPYATPTHRKRKRTSTTEDEATRLKQDPQFHLQDYTNVVMDGLNKLAARLDKIEGRLSSLEEGLSNVREDVRQVDHTISSELDAIVNPNVKYEVEVEVTNQLEELKEEVDVLVAGKLSDFEDEHEKGRARERQETDEYHEQLQQKIYNDMDRQFKEEWGRRQPEIKRLVNEQVKESIAKIRLAVID